MNLRDHIEITKTGRLYQLLAYVIDVTTGECLGSKHRTYGSRANAEADARQWIARVHAIAAHHATLTAEVRA